MINKGKAGHKLSSEGKVFSIAVKANQNSILSAVFSA